MGLPGGRYDEADGEGKLGGIKRRFLSKSHLVATDTPGPGGDGLAVNIHLIFCPVCMTRKVAALERLRLLKIPDLIRTTWQANDHFCYPFLASAASQVRFARPAYVLPIAVHVRDVPSQDITSQPAIVPLFHEGNVRQAEFPAVRAMSAGFA